MSYLVTGAAGFIGMHLCKRLSNTGNNKVIGIDNFNNYYDVNLKKNRIKSLLKNKKFKFFKKDYATNQSMENVVFI